MPAPPALHTVRISLPMQPENPRLLLMQSIGSNTQLCFHGAVEQECCTDSIPLDLPSPAEHTIMFPSLKPLRAVPINAKEGQLPPTETREGIDGSEVIAGSEIREGPSQCLCHYNSCSTCQSEQPHQMIANAMWSMLVGAGLPAKFWPYAFQHYLRFYNLILHAGQAHSPHEICSGPKPDLSQLCIFGCCVYAETSGQAG
jgi:hypothetical protein